MDCLEPGGDILSITVPFEDICGGTNPHWTILNVAVNNPIDVAQETVRKFTESAYNQLRRSPRRSQ